MDLRYWMKDCPQCGGTLEQGNITMNVPIILNTRFCVSCGKRFTLIITPDEDYSICIKKNK